jgi:chorismate synthase
VPILEAMIAFVLADALLEKLGGDSLAEMRPRFDGLRQARLSDLHLDGEAHVWWDEEELGSRGAGELGSQGAGGQGS